MADFTAWSSGLFGFLSRKAKLQFFAAVFFTFAPPAVLYELASSPPSPWYRLAIWTAFSGMVAVGWAFSFVRSRKYLFLVIPASVLLPMMFGHVYWGRPMSDHTRIVSILCIALIALGYAFFIRFISDEGVTSLRLRTEMGLAQAIHANLVPPVALRTAQLEIHGVSSPTTEVGGDLMDVFESDGSMHLYLADVSGHGVPAGVFMAMIKSAIRIRLLEASPLDRLVRDLNEVMLQVVQPGMFATFACMRFHASRSVEYALAGHLPILHYRAASRNLARLENENAPLGILPMDDAHARGVDASSGDLFVLLTDGFTEVMDARQEEFGSERIETLIVENAGRPLAEIHTAILDAVRRFGPQQDDQTLLLVRIR